MADSLAEALRLDPEAVKAGRGIAAIDPDSAGLLVGLMRRNADEATRLDEVIRQNVEDERDKWRNRAIRAEKELDAVRGNINRLLYPTEEQIEHVWDMGP